MKTSNFDEVYCDVCGTDWTLRPEAGGFLFMTTAYCPDCEIEGLVSIRKFKEQRFITGYCPTDISFADWIRSKR
jgi:hypothetical protein